MLLTKNRGNPPPADKLKPDRVGTLDGLSLTGFHRVVYTDWGPLEHDPEKWGPVFGKDHAQSNKLKRDDGGHPALGGPVPVLCVHGLTRQGRDFDFLAQRLARERRRVICPDLVGRGRSGRLRNPDEYALPQYCADLNALIAKTGAAQIDWVGTSLGGMIGIVLAGLPGNPIRRLVINDIGPYLPWSGLARLGGYVASMPTAFATFDDAETYFREVLAPFGALSDAQWEHLVRHSIAWDERKELFAMLCDPEIVRAFRNPWHYSIDLWKYWKAIRVPILVLRGEQSDLLPADLADRMERLNPLASVRVFADCGHAPPLLAAEQIAPVVEFLCGEE
jgi:pimeloyl-ACP methyl ester carboxylesterase